MTQRVIFLALMLAGGSLALSAHAAHAAWCPSSGKITESCTMSKGYSVPVTIMNNNVILKCQGYSIKSPVPRAPSSIGIYMKDRTNIELRNCRVENWATGILIEGRSSDIKLTSPNVTSYGMTSLTGNTKGAVFKGVDNITVGPNVQVTDNKDTGIEIAPDWRNPRYVQGVKMQGITMSGNRLGIAIAEALEPQIGGQRHTEGINLADTRDNTYGIVITQQTKNPFIHAHCADAFLSHLKRSDIFISDTTTDARGFRITDETQVRGEWAPCHMKIGKD